MYLKNSKIILKISGCVILNLHSIHIRIVYTLWFVIKFFYVNLYFFTEGCDYKMSKNKNLHKYSFFKAFFLLVFFIFYGCATTYSVKINGYIDPSRPFKTGEGPIFIIEDPNTKNPLLEREIVEKLNRMLKLKGYAQADFEKAKFYMQYSYGIGPEKTITSTMPVYTPGQTATITKTGPKGTSYSTVQVPGSTTYIPYTATVTDKWLFIKVLDGETYRNEGKDSILWIGEATTTSGENDIRHLINYLIAGISRYFGENTERTITVRISEDDPLLKGIMNKQ